MVQLTKKLILSRARAHNLNGVKTLNCWGNELTDVSILKELPNVEVINASVNDIENLEAFSSCRNLKELYLRRNKISSIDELSHLSALKNLKFVWLSGNPFCESLSTEDYRQAVIKVLPQLQKLDNNAVTSSELQKALQSTLEAHESTANESEISGDDKDDLNRSNTHPALSASNSSSRASSLKTDVLFSRSSLSSPIAGSGDFARVSPTELSIATSANQSVAASAVDSDPEDTLEETNKLRLELGLHPISPEKYNLSVIPHYQNSHGAKKPKKHKRHTGGNNILKATLCLIEELDAASLLTVQDAVQDRLEAVTSDFTSKEFVTS